MTGYLVFGIFIAFVLYVARPKRPDKVYHADEQVKEEYRNYLEGPDPYDLEDEDYEEGNDESDASAYEDEESPEGEEEKSEGTVR